MARSSSPHGSVIDRPRRLARRAVLVSLLLSVSMNPMSDRSASATVGDCTRSTSISTEADLLALAAEPSCLDETWTQLTDITLTENPWAPIAGFVGTYDGNNKSISGLRLGGNNAGLFGVGIDGATFKNLSIEVASGTANGSGVGALVGWSSGSLTIQNVSVSTSGNTSITGHSDVGGLVGMSTGEFVVIIDSHVSANVVGDTNVGGVYVGGLIGRTTNGSPGSFVSFTNNSVTGNVIGGAEVGGVLGSSPVETVTITSTSVTGNVTGDTNATGDFVGGLVGRTSNGAAGSFVTITNSNITGHVTGGSIVGGVLGSSPVEVITITSTDVTGNITGGDYIGGLIGWTTNGGSATSVTITNSGVDGHVVGRSKIGGVIGSTGAVAINFASTNIAGNVTGDTNLNGNYIGGLIGWTTNGGPDTAVSITNSSVVGDIAGASHLGGFLGSVGAISVTISNSDVVGSVLGDTTVTSEYVGGLVGWTTNGAPGSEVRITHSSITGNVVGNSKVAGLLGSSPALDITIESTMVSGNVTGDTNVNGDRVGGLIGWNTNGGTTLTISDSSVTGNITGRSEVGGILGNSPANSIIITDTSIAGSTYGVGDYVGGVIGRATNGQTALSFSDLAMMGNVTGTAFVGGAIGETFADTLTITRTAVVGNITGDTNVSGDTIGGFLGFAPSSAVTITDSFVRGSIWANFEAGGFIAWASDDVTLTNSYFAGAISASGTDRGSFIGKSTPGTLTITNSFCVDTDCPIDHKVTSSDLKSTDFLSSRNWDLNSTWCLRSELNDGFPTLRSLTRGALDAAACRLVDVPSLRETAVYRVSLDPAGGTCSDTIIRRERWSILFVGYHYLPGPSDCTRLGFAFAGWADTETPTQARLLPLLTDPSDGVRRFFAAGNLELVAMWTPVPPIIDVVVFANFLCGPCTNAWLIYRTPELVNDVVPAVNGVSTKCTQVGSVFGLDLCEITGLLPGSHSVALTPVIRTAFGSSQGLATVSNFSLRD